MPDESAIAYADDIAVIASEGSWDSTVNKMNIFLNFVANWLNANYLTLNIDKSVHIIFESYSNSEPDKTEIIHNKLLLRVESYKYLGIIIDYKLKWEEHIIYAVNETKYLLFIFYKLAKYTSVKVLFCML